MSFKRADDDFNLLKNLQHRRVCEILGDNIPDDEAKLLSNGRLACLICSRRPIFDTIQMLANHRKGKKHLCELSLYLQHKQVLAVRNRSLTPQQTSTSPGNRKTMFARKLTLTVSQPLEDTSTQPSSPSANSQVRHYLKTLSRKQPFIKTMNRLKESYNNVEVASEQPGPTKPDGGSVVKQQSNSDVLKYLESGWIKGSDGKWVKDPNVEFNSDEDEPPV